MAATEEDDFWGHDVKKADTKSLKEPSRKGSVDKTVNGENGPSRKASAKTVRSVKSVKHATINEDEQRRDSDNVSLKQSIKSGTSRKAAEETKDENDDDEVKRITEDVDETDLDDEKHIRTPSPVSDASLGLEKGELNDSRASLLSDAAENYYKDDEFEVDEQQPTSTLDESRNLNNDDTKVSDQEEPKSQVDRSSTIDVVAVPTTSEEKPKKKVKKKKKDKDDKKKKSTDKKVSTSSTTSVLGLLAQQPTVLAGAIVQAPPEKLKGKVKKKSTPSTSDTKSSPIKKKFVDSSSKSPRITKSSRSRTSLDEISYLRKQLNEVVKENRTLRQIQRRQDTALARFESNNSDMPNLLNRYTEEVRVLKEQLRGQKEKNRERERILRQRSLQMEKLRDKAKKFEKMLTDKGVVLRKRDEKSSEQLEEMLDDKEKRIKELERQTELLSKNFKHQFNIEVLRHKETQRKLNEYTAEYQRLTGRDINLNNNNNVAAPTQFSQRSPRRNGNYYDASPRRIAGDYQIARSGTAEVLVNSSNTTQIPRRNYNSKPKKIPNDSNKRSPQRKMNDDTSSLRRLPLASTKTQSVEEDRTANSPKLTLFADYQRSLSSTPKKESVAQGLATSKTNERLSSPYNDDLIRDSEKQPSRKQSPLTQNEKPKSALISQTDAEDSLLDFTKRPLGGANNSLVADDPFTELKKNAPSSAVRSSTSNNNAFDDLFPPSQSKVNVEEKKPGEESTRNSADSGLASTGDSPNQTDAKRQSKNGNGGARKNLFDMDDQDLFPAAKPKAGPKLANGLFPWEQDAVTKTKS